jgi:geranylgeranyl transferase type-2 subunit alpha
MAYTTKKIDANFSNFSAWHQRSKVLTSLWSSGKLEPHKSKEAGTLRGIHISTLMNAYLKFLEFDLVRNAMYTDPADQSVWMYHRWLVGCGK